jgi:bifunctional UDP-N-acetylglucosamine pyrophosphorylase/glucosamine-1-phosphate N-acetyltransferase
MNLHAVVLAAGKGSRMKSHLPKVLHPIAGQPMLHRVLATTAALQPNTISLVLGHGIEAIEASLATQAVTTRSVLQAQQLGTGHAVGLALADIPDDTICLVLYGDVPLISTQTLEQCVAVAEQGHMAVVTANVADPAELGRITRNAEGSIEAIVEHKDASPAQRAIQEINSGILAVSSERLRGWISNLDSNNSQGEYYLTDTIAMAVQAGITVTGIVAADENEVLGVNDRIQLAQAERIYQLQQAQALMRGGTTLLDPSRMDIRGTLTCGADCVIDVNTVFIGNVTLGDGVVIGPNAVIEDSVIGSGVTVQPNTVIEGAVVGDHCSLGPFARVRPGSHFEAGVKIGNFVETKKVSLGQGTKASHLTYLGDATIGANTNIGAGTVTCNYDGVDKHHTHIGQDAFIGTNSTLVAPLEVGDSAFVAAGSTITSKVDDHDLAVGRTRQRNIANWRSPQDRKK